MLSQAEKDDLVLGLVPESVKEELFTKVEALIAAHAAPGGGFSQADIDAAAANAVAAYKAALIPQIEAVVVSANEAEKLAVLAAIV